ncbi:MAG: alpha/beta hydrolase [Eubacteriales bacterium]|nr:alpha/beta hydrolase [Eubacteriales bacterium]
MHTQKIVLNQERNVTLTIYLQEIGEQYLRIRKRPAVLILPGGGYQFCADSEGEPVALEYLTSGFQAFVLRYSVGKDAVWPNPLNDYETAMEYILAHADEWHIFPEEIAVVGFSAGGHLAACAATMAKHKPSAAILGYAATIKNFISICAPNAPGPVDAVDRKTCPCFVFATRNDKVVPAENTLQFINALYTNGISFESHIYGYGPHGFSTVNPTIQDSSVLCSRAPHWVADSMEWLWDIWGNIDAEPDRKPRCARTVGGNYGEFLSIECTTDCVLKSDSAKELLRSLGMGELLSSMENLKGSNIVLRQILEYTQLSDEQIIEIDTLLSKISNPQ